MMQSKTYGVAWYDGRDPEDGGWHFDNGGGTVDGYTMAYETGSRDAAAQAGVPDAILDMFEAGGGVYDDPGGGLFYWLQDHNDLFRT